MTSPLVWAAGAVTLVVALVASYLAMTAAVAPDAPDLVAIRVSAAFGLAFALVGLLILVRRPGNRIGWVTLGLGVGLALLVTGSALVSASRDRNEQVASIVGFALFIDMVLTFSLATAFVLWFPDGRLPSRGWRPVGWAIVAWTVLTLVAGILSPALLAGGFGFVPNPTGGVVGPVGDLAEAILPALNGGGFLLLFSAAVVAALFRFTRSRGVERQQLKWFAYAAGFFLLTQLLVTAIGREFAMLGSLSLLTLPIALAIAVLRYRLYDIDLLINRTVVYGATSAAIAATFYLGIVALQPILRPLTSGSELAVAASTLVSFALFHPIRRRVQGAVDHRFNRARYDATRTVDAFADQLRDEVDLDALRAELLGAVSRTMAPAHASLWLRERAR